MFEEIDTLEWDKIKTNIGNASHVPDALMGLISKNKDEVEKAYWKIENYVVLQGDLSESAKYLPKFLEEAFFLANYKGGILELLFQIGNGVSLDEELENECYQNVIEVLTRIRNNQSIVGTKWAKSIDEDLMDLKALHSERS